MKKVFRIILLVLAVIAAIVSLYTLIAHVYSIIYFINRIPDDSRYIEHLWNYLESTSRTSFVAFSAALFAIIYIVFTLKNGLGKTLYSSIALGIEDLREARDKRKKERIKEQISELEETLEQLKQEESE